MTNADIIVNLATMIAEQRLEIQELKTEVAHLHHELVATMSEADTPQTDLSAEEFVEGMKNLKMEVKQTDCEACELDGKADVCKICRVSNYEPQTDCGWK